MGSCVCHISTTLPPMDLKPLAFAPSGADAHNAHDAHDAVPTVACKHYLNHPNPTQPNLKSSQVKSSRVKSSRVNPSQALMLCRLYCTTSTTMWDLVFAISLQLYHLWTSNHLHSLPLVQMHTMHTMHTMQYRLWPVSTTWTIPTQPK